MTIRLQQRNTIVFPATPCEYRYEFSCSVKKSHKKQKFATRNVVGYGSAEDNQFDISEGASSLADLAPSVRFSKTWLGIQITTTLLFRNSMELANLSIRAFLTLP